MSGAARLPESEERKKGRGLAAALLPLLLGVLIDDSIAVGLSLSISRHKCEERAGTPDRRFKSVVM